MKRYDLEDTSYCGRGEYGMVEDPDGEWIKYEDVKEAIGIFNDWRDGNLPQVECICRKASLDLFSNWICPAHGYKERLHVETKSKVTPLEY